MQFVCLYSFQTKTKKKIPPIDEKTSVQFYEDRTVIYNALRELTWSTLKKNREKTGKTKVMRSRQTSSALL